MIWYHVGCVKPVEVEASIPTEDIAGTSSRDDVLESLLRLPIERGFLAGIVGNGQVQLALRENAKKGRPFAEDAFNIRYLALFTGREMYVCPTCQMII